MPVYPNPAGGSMTVANEAEARAAGWTPSMGTFGINSGYDPGQSYAGQVTSGGGGAAPTVAAQSSQQLASGINSLLGAIASGNKEAFNEAVRQFNATFGLDQEKFAEATRQFNQNYGLAQGGLTGTYQNAPTLAAQAQYAGLYGNAGLPPTPGMTTLNAQQQAFGQQQALAELYGTGYANWGQVPGNQQTLAAQNQAYTQQMGMINSAAALQANPFRQQQALGQMNQLLGGQGVAGFQAPNVVGGVGVAGGNTAGGMGYLQQMIDDIRDPTANQASMTQIMQGIPTPNKLNSTEFLRAAPSTQSMVLQGMQEKYGLNPEDAQKQILATLPQFKAPTTMGGYQR